MDEIEEDRVHIRNRRGQQRTSDEEIRALLGVPAGYTVLNLVAIGEKGENKRPYTDQDLHFENVHYDLLRNKLLMWN